MPILVYDELGTPPASAPFPELYVPDANFIAEMRWLHAWYHGGRLPAKPIVITSDNGYVPQATFAPARLISIGWEIDSHSVTHPDLTTLTTGGLRYQVVAARRFLQRRCCIPVNSFCYPSNRYDAAVIAAVKAAGYGSAQTEDPGFASRAHPYLLDRFEITDGVQQLTTDLRSG